MAGLIKEVIILSCLTATLALRIELPTPQDLHDVRMAAKARTNQDLQAPSLMERGQTNQDPQAALRWNGAELPDTQTPGVSPTLSPLLSLMPNIASTMLHGNVANMAAKQGVDLAYGYETALPKLARMLTHPTFSQPPEASRLGPRALEFAAEAKEDHGDQWVEIAMQRFQSKECPTTMLAGIGQVLPDWTVLALKDGGADIGKSTNGVLMDWMRYGNYCGNQMHGNGYGDLTQGEAACSVRNEKITSYEFRGLKYDVCDDCGLDAGCALHDSSWVHQIVNAETVGSEKGPTMCAANEAFTARMYEATHSGCNKNFRDGFGVSEAGYVKLASCSMIFAPCINYEGPSLKTLQRVNPSVYRHCKMDTQESGSNIKLLACLAMHWMNYRVPLGDYSGIKLKCTPEDANCFIQGDARGTKLFSKLTTSNSTGKGGKQSLMEQSHSSSRSSTTSCGPISSPSQSLCRAIARHVVVDDKGTFYAASGDLVSERAPLSSQDLISLDHEITSDPEITKILAATVKPNVIQPIHDRRIWKWSKKPEGVADAVDPSEVPISDWCDVSLDCSDGQLFCRDSCVMEKACEAQWDSACPNATKSGPKANETDFNPCETATSTDSASDLLGRPGLSPRPSEEKQKEFCEEKCNTACPVSPEAVLGKVAVLARYVVANKAGSIQSGSNWVISSDTPSTLTEELFVEQINNGLQDAVPGVPAFATSQQMSGGVWYWAHQTYSKFDVPIYDWWDESAVPRGAAGLNSKTWARCSQLTCYAPATTYSWIGNYLIGNTQSAGKPNVKMDPRWGYEFGAWKPFDVTTGGTPGISSKCVPACDENARDRWPYSAASNAAFALCKADDQCRAFEITPLYKYSNLDQTNWGVQAGYERWGFRSFVVMQVPFEVREDRSLYDELETTWDTTGTSYPERLDRSFMMK